jgi:thioredoxin-like negative regulator of GroEL
VAEKLAGRAAVVQVNVDENPQLSSRFGVTGIPALFLIKKGRVVDRITGAQSAEAVVEWFRRNEGG